MGMLMGGFYSQGAAGGSPGLVTLTGANIDSSSAPPDTCACSIEFRSDGTVWKEELVDGAGSPVQLSSTTDWIIPTGDASSTFDVRLASYGGGSDTFTTLAEVLGTWINLGANRKWTIFKDAEGSWSVAATFEIRYDGGSALDSGLYNLDVNIIP